MKEQQDVVESQRQMGYLHQATKESTGPGPGTALPHRGAVSIALGTGLCHGNQLTHKQCLDTLQQQPATTPNTRFCMGHLVEVGVEKTSQSKATTRRLALRPVSSLLACFIYYCRSNHEYHNSFSTVKFTERALPLTGTARLLQPRRLSFFLLFLLLEIFLQTLFNLPSLHALSGLIFN